MRGLSPLRYRWPLSARLFFTFLMIVTLVAPIPYVFFKPGTPDDISGSLITIKKAATYPIHGKLLITSILVTNPDAPVFGAETIFHWAVGPNVVLPRESIYPSTVNDESESSQSANEMSDSQLSATAAALRYLNIPITDRYVVRDVRTYSKAYGILEIGDRILSIDGKEIRDIEEIRSSYAKKKIGDYLTMTIERVDSQGGKRVFTSRIELVSNGEAGATPEMKARPAIGILVGVDAEFPIDVKFNLGNVGGPSAGLIFAIGIVDKLTSEDLIRGRIIAGTGTISPSGKVGEIGGIEEKLIGASRSGATLFLAPRGNCPDIRHIPKGMRVVPANTLQEAIEILRAPENSKFPTC